MEILNLNRMNDVLFKAVFGENPNITLSFINSVFSYQGTATFKSIDFIDRELNPIEEEAKESRLDLVGKDSITDEKVNLEVQMIKQKYFGERSLYYWARLYNDLKSGEDYDKLTRTVTINVLDFKLFDDESKTEKNKSDTWHSCFGIYDIKTKRQLTDHLEMHFIELPKWKIQKDIKDMNTLEHWVSYFDKKTDPQELEEIAMQEPMIKEAIRAESIFTQDEIKRRAYELKEKAARDYRGHIKYYREEGYNQGLSQGISQGLKQGKMDMILKLLEANQPISLIAQVSDFPEEKIAKIGKENGIAVKI